MRHPRLLAALLLLATAAPAAAQNVPKRLDFQGFLSDANGAPAEGEWIVTFRLFGAEDGQLPFFEETITVEPVTGVFGVTLGAAPGNPLPTEPFEDGSVWAAFVVSGGAGPVELAPRLRITSAPYALHAGKAASAGQADNALSLGGVGAGSYVTLSQLPELCVTGEGLPGLLEDLGYTPGAAYTDADVLAFLQDGGYEPCACYGDPEVQLYLDLMGYTPGGSYGDPEVQAFLDLHGYVPGPHYTDADVQDWLDLMGYTAGSGYSDADVQAYLDLLGYTPGAGYTDQDVLDLLDDQGWPLPEDVLLVDGSRDLAGDWDVAKHQLLNLVVHNASAAQPPAAPAAGQLWFDTTAGALRFYTGNAWVSVGTGTVAGDLSCGGCVDATDVSFSWAQGDAPGGAALSAKSLACTGCVVPSHLTVPYAGSATKGGPAGDLDCPACVSAAEVSFPWAAGVAPGGAALVANQAANADTLDFQDSTDFEPAGAVAAHQAGVPHLTAAEEAALTGGGVTTLHAHPASPGSGAAPARVRQTSKDVNLPPLGSTRERLHVFSAAAPKVYLYLYGETYSNMVLPNHGHGTHNHTFSQSIAGWQPASYRCGDNQCTSSTTVTVSSVTTGTGTYPLTDVSGTATPKGVQIWIDGADRTAAIGDQQGKGAPAWGGTSWGTGTAWETGRLDLSNAVDWGVGEHVLEFRETGNAGGRLSYSVYLVDPAASSAPFPNDACGGALPLAFTGGVAVVKATTEDMLGENKALDDLAPAGCGGAGGGDVVYSLTLTVRTTLHAALAAPFAGRVYVLASPCATQQVLACGTTLATTAELDPGTYFVVVDSDDPGEKGDFTLTVTQEPSPLPPNDTCATAQAMAPSGSPLVVTGTTKWGLDQYEGTCGGGAAADTVYTFQATDVNDDLSVTLTGGFAAVLVLRAQSCETGFQLSCSTNKSLSVQGLVAGTYYLFVDGVTAADEGPFSLSVTLN